MHMTANSAIAIICIICSPYMDVESRHRGPEFSHNYVPHNFTIAIHCRSLHLASSHYHMVTVTIHFYSEI